MADQDHHSEETRNEGISPLRGPDAKRDRGKILLLIRTMHDGFFELQDAFPEVTAEKHFLVLNDLRGLIHGILSGAITKGQPRIKTSLFELFESIAPVLRAEQNDPASERGKEIIGFLSCFQLLVELTAEYGLSAEDQSFVRSPTLSR